MFYTTTFCERSASQKGHAFYFECHDEIPSPSVISRGECYFSAKVNKFEHVGGIGLCDLWLTNGTMVVVATWGPPVDRQTDRQTRLKTLPCRNFVGCIENRSTPLQHRHNGKFK